MKKPGGLALVIAEKMGASKDKPDDEGDELPDGKVAAMEEFHAAMSSSDHEAAAKAMQSFVSMCRYGDGEES